MPEFLYHKKLYYTPVEFLMDRIGGTWKMPLLWRLKDTPMRYGALKKSMPRITDKMLSATLGELERDGLVCRIAIETPSSHMAYALSERGISLIPLIADMRTHGYRLMQEFGVGHPEIRVQTAEGPASDR